MPIEEAFEQINTLNNNKLLGLDGIYATVLKELKYKTVDLSYGA